jgi:large subunit ribosomal protein L7Ae
VAGCPRGPCPVIARAGALLTAAAPAPPLSHPPPQFRNPLDKAESLPLFTLLAKYQPEKAAAKKERLVKQAADKKAGGTGTSPAPVVLKYGLNHITYLVEQKKAKLVVIAADVDPIELVVWLPALCRKFGVPYAIVNNKGRLGALVEKKTAAAVALTGVHAVDEAALAKVSETANARFRDNVDGRRKWGGGVMGLKTQRRLEKREKLIQAELAKKAML